jgi:glycosyltransferase involved in cell wall biosynthesis
MVWDMVHALAQDRPMRDGDLEHRLVSPQLSVALSDVDPPWASRFAAPLFESPERATERLTTSHWLECFDRTLSRTLLHTHHLTASVIAARLGRPFVCSFHSLWPSVAAFLTGKAANTERLWLAAECFRAARAIVVPTNVERSLLEALAASAASARNIASKVVVIPWGQPRLDVGSPDEMLIRRRAVRDAILPGVPDDALVLYNVGRFVAYKKQASVIRAFARVAPSHPRAWLLLVGPHAQGGYAEEVHDALQSLPVAVRERVVIPGALSAEDAHLAGDILVHASTVESWCRVVDEAWQMGRPTVISAIPTIAERAGYHWRHHAPASLDPARPAHFLFAAHSQEALSVLIDPHDESSIARGIDHALADASWRAETASRNRELARARDWQSTARQMEALYRDILSSELPLKMAS